MLAVELLVMVLVGPEDSQAGHG